MKRLIGLLAALTLLTGCYRLHFNSGDAKGAAYDSWHHNIAFSLVEVSPPVEANKMCSESKWARITTQDTVVTAIAGGVDLFIGIDLWDPQMVQVQCK